MSITVNRRRMADEFCELVSIDSNSKSERRMADALKSKLKAIGYEVVEDNAGEKIGGDTGNLICKIKGNLASKTPVLVFLSHMDTVPGIGKKAIIDGDIIRTDGSTILGADDITGIVCMLETLRLLKETGTKHGDFVLVFTVAEEAGLLGAINLDCASLGADYGLVLDSSGSVGEIDVRAPAEYYMEAEITGKAAHAGMEPEKGINAIRIAADAIAGMKQGRIDYETTANIGEIHGGTAVNIVCDKVLVKAESRSRDKAKLEAQVNHMRECFEASAAKFGGTVDFRPRLLYDAFNVPEQSPVIELLGKAAAKTGVELRMKHTGGGSDTNILNACGLLTVNLSISMMKVHTSQEYTSIKDNIKTVEFMVNILKTAAEERV